MGNERKFKEEKKQQNAKKTVLTTFLQRLRNTSTSYFLLTFFYLKPFITTFKQVKLLSFFFHDNNQSNSINYYMRANFQSNLSPQKLYRPTIQQQQRDGLFVITRFFSTLLPLCSHNIQRNESSSDFKNQH